MAKLVLFNKPFHVLSQFTDKENRRTLAEFINDPSLHVCGRLDFDSEGLLLLTDSGALKHQITHPSNNKYKTYWVQVEGTITTEAIQHLQQGVQLKDGMTRPSKARVIDPPSIWERDPPIRDRKSIPTSWLELSISEGKNRQVRRMTAAVGYATLRLIRAQIDQWSLDRLKPGEKREVQIHLPRQPTSRPFEHRSQRTGRKTRPHKKQPEKK